jgi:putative transposase
MNPKGAGHRRSIRMPGYDYGSAGDYFVTICVENRECLFGDIAEGKMVLNDAGRMIQTVWEELPEFYPGVGIDAFQIMPNHVHGIIILVGATPRGCPDPTGPRGCQNEKGPHARPDQTGQPRDVVGQPQGVAPTGDTTGGMSLPDVVHRFKTLTSRKYVSGVKQNHWFPFSGKLWQRNYYEHVVRNDAELLRMRKYILDNPRRWHLDHENPNLSIKRT